MDPLQWMGAVRMKFQILIKTSQWSTQHWLCVNNVLWINVFWLLYHNIACSSENVWIRREMCACQTPLTSQNRSKQIFCWILMWEVNGMDVFTEWSIVIDYGLFCFVFCPEERFKFKCLNHDGFVYFINTQLFTSQDVYWWSRVDYCYFFISCLDSFWRHPFKWCNATFL